jgi:hypothetical protein
MKKISFLIILCLTAILLLFAACDKTCGIKSPKDVKPIDWENYNSVYDVFYNYYRLCSEQRYEDSEKTIMVSGWLYRLWGGYFILRNIPNHTNEDSEFPSIQLLIYGIEKEFIAKIDTCDLTKKCFVKGELIFGCAEAGLCSTSAPLIIIKSVDDIYFE